MPQVPLEPTRGDRPADGMGHPVVLVALLVLVLNDQLAKPAWPGVVTGKLSDVAGLIVAPIALQAVWELIAWLTGRWSGPSDRVLVTSIGLVGVAFAAIQLWTPATDAYRWALGVVQWPLRAAAAVVVGGPVGAVVPVQATADVEDLLALPALLVTWWAGRRRGSRRAAGPAA
jgi:hypothetical protein